MAETRNVPVGELELDRRNFRTVEQTSEPGAVQAMILTSPNRFWGLTKSLLESGYLPTENILVLKGNGRKPALTVKEGNRRIAALKLIHGQFDRSQFAIPTAIERDMEELPPEWFTENGAVPCAVYDPSESEIVDRIVTLAHGKADNASKDKWNAVARARHNKNARGATEAPLDLLEKYVEHGRNHNADQASRWAGDYPLTVLEEAMKKLAPRLGLRSAREVAGAYPSIKHRAALEAIMRDIGLELLGFKGIRGTDFAAGYGISPVGKAAESDKSHEGRSKGDGARGSEMLEERVPVKTDAGPEKPKASSTKDPTAVKTLLKAFHPRGSGREKVVLLRDEAHALNLRNNPIAFCFVLRSMFEISAKAYCEDHVASAGPSMTRANGQDKHLADALRDIVKHLTKNGSDKVMEKRLYGAVAELASKDGVLSVTSMNQLVHNTRYAVTTSDLCVMFGNVFPLLEALNA